MDRPRDMLPEQVTEARVALGLTRDELARRLEVSHATIWRWETGRSRPTRRLQKALKRLR